MWTNAHRPSVGRTAIGTLNLRPLHPFIAILLVLAALHGARAEDAREVVDLRPRPEVTLRLLLIKPAAPVASVILFTGGDGRLGIGDGGDLRFGGNFLVRTRERWAREGFLTILADAPSDYQAARDGLGAFRLYAGHARDIAAIIAFARSRAPVPVWIIGTSRGTLSVANAGARLGAEGADGIVLTSTILSGFKTRGSPGSDDVFDVDLAAIRKPVLIAHHREDACTATPFAVVAALQRKLVNAPEVGLLAYEGGLPPISSPCEARSQHGYYGLERRVVGEIGAWIKARLR